MNKLSYKIEQTEIDDGYEKFTIEDFYYVVDGKKLEYQNYNPADSWTMLETGYEDDPFEEKQMVILNRCTCGIWECDCIAAAITETSSTIQWQIHKLRDEKIITTYEFDKEEYTIVMQEIKRTALKKIGKGSFFHWKDGSTYVLSDTRKIDILRYWKQQCDQKTPLAYFEDIETGKLFTVIDNKEIVSYKKRNKTGEKDEDN